MQRSTLSCNSVCRRRRKLSSHVRGKRGCHSFSMVDSEDRKTVVTRAILTVKTEVEAVMARLAFATPSACDL